jgi:hypothetical protein
VHHAIDTPVGEPQFRNPPGGSCKFWGCETSAPEREEKARDDRGKGSGAGVDPEGEWATLSGVRIERYLGQGVQEWIRRGEWAPLYTIPSRIP